MFSRCILSAFFVAALSSHAVSGASLLDRRAELAPRSLTGATTQHVHVVPRTNNYWRSQIALWSGLSGSFAQCQEGFQARVDVSIAVQSVNALYAHVNELCTQFASYSADVMVDERITIEFRTHISEVFTAWQNLLIVGRENYGRHWNYYFRPTFARFTVLVQTMSSLCVQLRIDLRGLLLGLNLDVNVFVGAGINLNAVLNVGLLN